MKTLLRFIGFVFCLFFPLTVSAQTGVIYHTDYLLHDAGPQHPERPARLQAIMSALSNLHPQTKFMRIPPRQLSDDRWLRTVHTDTYLELLRDAERTAPVRLDPDTVVSKQSFRVAKLAVGGAMAAVDAVMTGRIKNAFVAARPPGHHAFSERGSGFCLLNTVAIATRYIQEKYGIKKVLIIDWDVHHGNGTQDIFYSDPNVFYFSTHQWPYYPGTGARTDKGTGKGLGTNLNVPVPAGTGDTELIKIFNEKLLPAAAAFGPEFVFISAGFDAHRNDPLAGLGLTADGYRQLTRIVKNLALGTARGRIVSVLEGGYNLDALAESVAVHVEELARDSGSRR